MKPAIVLLAVLQLGGLGATRAAWAQAPLSDPTRPPASLIAPVRTTDGVIAAPAVRPEPRLQSVLVSLRPGGRRIAVIDGKMVREGQRVGDAVVVSIRAKEVELRRAGRTQTIKLFRPAAKVAQVQP